MGKKRILSGMRPTGRLHLGNYFGALQNWVRLQDEYECFFMVADWHALTSEWQDTSEIAELTRQIVIDWLAVGLDPQRSALFVQSQVKQHAELALLLGMFTPLPWLERCPTYKEQIKEISNRDLSNYGFLGYPVLQAADITVYDAEAVPIGEDQVPHLEMTREMVRRINHIYGEVLVEPRAILSPTPKLLGYDGRKMSKSYDNCIYLSDSADEVTDKVMQMVTDPQRVRREDPGNPDICSVFDYQKILSKDRLDWIDKGCRSASIGCVDDKKLLAERLNALLEPFRAKRRALEANPQEVDRVIEEGNARARAAAETTMRRVRKALNLPEN
ncbi:tryptophan--tRNA ligase [candidate division BRC1 bacterium SM23_51]|nr:MAG: tryptophan--tRNA ligase [candidate division BRC1 bacterium SM23_51]